MPMWNKKPNVLFGLPVIHVVFQRQYCECEFWELSNFKVLEVPVSVARISVVTVPRVPSLHHQHYSSSSSTRQSCPRKHNPKFLHSLSMRTAQCGGWMRKDIVLHAVWKEIKGRRGSQLFLLFSVSIICCHHELFYFHRLILGSASGAGGCTSVWHLRVTWPRLCCPITI